MVDPTGFVAALVGLPLPFLGAAALVVVGRRLMDAIA
jgi:hypothetical protein